MPRTVPSQIVALIDRRFPNIDAPSLGLDHSTVGVFSAVVRLIDEIPQELLALSGADYDDLVCGAQVIGNVVAFWERKGVGLVGQPSIGNKKALNLIRAALAKCPDQIPWGEEPSSASARLAATG